MNGPVRKANCVHHNSEFGAVTIRGVKVNVVGGCQNPTDSKRCHAVGAAGCRYQEWSGARYIHTSGHLDLGRLVRRPACQPCSRVAQSDVHITRDIFNGEWFIGMAYDVEACHDLIFPWSGWLMACMVHQAGVQDCLTGSDHSV